MNERGSALSDTIQVTLAGEMDNVLRRETERELDEFVRSASLVTGGPKELADFFRELRRTVTELASTEISSEAEDFLDGVITTPLNPRRRLDLVSRGVLRDFARRNAIVEESLAGAEVAQHLKLSRQAVNDRWRRGRLLGFRINDTVRFPSWQFDAKQQEGVLIGLPDVILALTKAELTPLEQVYWMTSPKPQFEARTPIQLLNEGQVAPVLSYARAAGAR